MLDVTQTTVETLLTELQMKYKESLDGLNLESYLYSTASKLALVKNFKDEVFSMLSTQPSEMVRASPVCLMRDYTQTD